MKVVPTATIQRALLTALPITYFLVPTRLPRVEWSPHGVLLLAALGVYALTGVRTLRASESWPFLLMPIAVAASWASAGGRADIGTVRAIVFGVAAAFLISQYLRRRDAIRALVVLGCIVVLVSLGMSGLYVSAALGAGIRHFDPFAAVFGQSSYHSALFLLISIPAMIFLAASGRILPLVLLIPLWIALIISGLRGVWTGALVAMLSFGIASGRSRQTAAALGIAALSFLLMTSLTARYLNNLNRVHDTPAEQFAPESESSAATLAAANLAAKTSPESGLDKLSEELTTSGRLGYWMTGVRMWAAFPVFGVGPGNFARTSEAYSVHAGQRRDAEKGFDAHNMFVSILAELGIVGFAMLGALVAIPAYRWCRSWRADRLDRDALALVGAVFAGLTVVGLTWDIHMQRIWWIALGLVWASTTSDAHPARSDRHHGGAY